MNVATQTNLTCFPNFKLANAYVPSHLHNLHFRKIIPYPNWITSMLEIWTIEYYDMSEVYDCHKMSSER